MPSGTPVSGPFPHLILGEGGRLFSLCHFYLQLNLATTFRGLSLQSTHCGYLGDWDIIMSVAQ